ncbi:MAG: hypothetical protein IJ877_07975 [Candidatus Gastranaerophilales bacterium]|nr:hypothetical protein [Candidatus Gastranaerophilales bacterium]
MEKLREAQLSNPRFKEPELGAQNPIIRDNRAFDIVDGDKKTLDYLDYSSTITKGTLAANGSIRLKPNCNQEFKHDYGAFAPEHDYMANIPRYPLSQEEYTKDDDLDNEWSNIFLKQNEGEYDIPKDDDPYPEDNITDTGEDNFFKYKPNPELVMTAYAS